MMKRFLILLLTILVMSGGSVTADFYGVIAFDSSNNMLARPDGPSGTLVSLAGGMNRTVGGVRMSYDFAGGALERYHGVQYHIHQLSAQYLLPTDSAGDWGAGLSGRIARYGDVSIFDGYNDISAWVNGKIYLTSSLLFRWRGRINRRRYDPYDRESATDVDTYVRIDRFLDSGTTLRGQLEGGIRRYDRQDGSRALVGGLRIRAAQSLGNRWGAWIEGHLQRLDSNAGTSGASYTDRIFLDDRYTYASRGVACHLKHVFGGGAAELEIRYVIRDYPGGIASTYWYLPDDGWDEREWAARLNLSWQPGFLPSLVYPSMSVYYTDVAASAEVLGYQTTGASLSFSLY